MIDMGLLTDVPGVMVGHVSNYEDITGCTVILFENSAEGVVDLRGGGTSTRQLDPLFSSHSYGSINGILLTGGSAYGLDAAGGVMRYLEERGIGLKVGYGMVVPSVPTAVIFDLGIGNGKRRPDSDMGYRACLNASTLGFEEGSVGVGTGATVGKLLGIKNATKGGVGSASYTLSDGVVVGALVVVNAFGDVVDPESGRIIAGVRDSSGGRDFPGSVNLLKQGVKWQVESFQNTTLAVICTNAKLNRSELKRVSKMGQTGIARVILPAHTVADGDLVFAVSCGELAGDPNVIGVVAAELVSEAIVRAVKKARGLGGIPSWSDIEGYL
jgi:L-aminopeptidase/D-esterase-like protein